MNTFQIMSLLGCFLAGRAAAESGFSSTCDEITVAYDASSVEAKCQVDIPMGPPWICSQLDLNKCIGNSHGKLVAEDDGNFEGSCSDCFEVSSLTIGCNCDTGAQDSDGHPALRYSEIDLDDFIGNDVGYLKCFDNVASKSSSCH